ncbi:unnamed protein product [Rotaria sordida]|uniref:FMN hydroxy acid dehydrogenase domain-containing protein n=1 Tax=Rotaria sordida TaxID=392033 RepID=A0A820C1V0_9BILA|nr:unnamed protein product [Rotaria sordida]
MKNSQLYILCFGTTLTSIVILLNYFQRKKRKKQNEKRKNEYLQCKTLSDFEELAKKSMMPHRFYYYDYKAGQGHTYQACRHYFDKQLRIMPRVLMDVSEISLKTSILGSIYESPILIAASACHCLAHVDGEVATVRAATETQCIFTYNWTFSNVPEEKVLQTLGPKFLHIYLTTPIEILEQIVPQADKEGYRAIVITCDQPHERIRDFVLPLFEEA